MFISFGDKITLDFLERKSTKNFAQLASRRKLHKKIPVKLYLMQFNWDLNLLDRYGIIKKEIADGDTSALPVKFLV